MQRTLVVGIDAATWEMMNPLLEAGRLPTLKSLIESGTAGSATSTMPPMTPLAWTSIATGVEPGEHGIYGFREQNRETYEVSPINFGSLSRPTVWDVFDAHGRTVGVINYPIASPPPEVEGFFISGFPGSDKGVQAHPEEVQQIARESDFRVKPKRHPQDGLEAYYQEVVKITKAQRDITLELLDQYDLDLLWPVFMGIDWVQHYLWDKEIDGTDAVTSMYELIDKVLGDLIAAVGDDWDIVAISDHGFAGLDGEVHLNGVLERLGYVSREQEERSISEKAKDATAKAVWNLGSKLPYSLKRGVKRTTPDSFLSLTREAAGVGMPEIESAIDWTETTAFAYDSMGKIYIHTEDQYPKGTVDSVDYDAVRQAVIEDLYDLRDPETGQQIVAEVHRGENLYEGRSRTAPDLVVEPADWRYAFYGDFGDEWFHEPQDRLADHEPRGILVLSGRNVVHKEVELETDVSATAAGILAMSGLPVFEDANRALLDHLELDPVYEDPEEYRATVSKSGGGKGVEERLQDLGYM